MNKKEPPKTIVICADGTGNVGGSSTPTNVWRIREAVAKQNDDGENQVLIYQDGVGTSRFRPLEILGKSISFGITPNLVQLYAQLMQVYRPGDKVFLFGFSRGAFTARVLANLCYECGLANCRDEDDKLYAPFEIAELANRAVAVYKLRHITDKDGISLTEKFREEYGLRGKGVSHPFEDLADHLNGNPGRIPIEFVGVWDTVASVGLPFDNATQALMRFWRGVTSLSPAFRWASFAQLSFRRPTTKDWTQWEDDLHPMIGQACHALAVDDERQAFKPVLWLEYEKERDQDGKTIQDAGFVRKENVQQVWFAGMHANVGGGYAKDSIAYVSLGWMMLHAQNAGLKFEWSSFDRVIDMRDENGQMDDSRSGLAMYYRYQPRLIKELCAEVGLSRDEPAIPKDENKEWRPRIHESVFRRIAQCPDVYSPVGLPDDGEYISVDHNIERKVEDLNDRELVAAVLEKATEKSGASAPVAQVIRGFDTFLRNDVRDNIEGQWKRNRSIDQTRLLSKIVAKTNESTFGIDDSADNADESNGIDAAPEDDEETGAKEALASSAEEARELAQQITRGYIHLRRSVYYALFVLTTAFFAVGFFDARPGVLAPVDRWIFNSIGWGVDKLLVIPPIVSVTMLPVIGVILFLSIRSKRQADRLLLADLGEKRPVWNLIPRGMAFMLLAMILRPLVNLFGQWIVPGVGEHLVGVLGSPAWFALFVFAAYLIINFNAFARSRMVQWNTFAWRTLQGYTNVGDLKISRTDRRAKRIKADSKMAEIFDRFVVPAYAFAVLAAVMAYPIWITVQDVVVRMRVAHHAPMQSQSGATTPSEPDSETPPSSDDIGTTPLTYHFATRDVLETGRRVRPGVQYVIDVSEGTGDDQWKDESIDADVTGFDSDRMPWVVRAATPLKRDRDARWFYFSGCVGDPLARAFPIESGVPFSVAEEGILYLMVNDVPGFYHNNQGTAQITIRRLRMHER